MDKKGKNFSTNNKVEKRNKNDYYVTPYSMTRKILEREKLEGLTLEPACGEAKAIVKVLDEYNIQNISSDLSINSIDFLSNNLYIDSNIENVITNPPFKLANEFILKSKKVAKKKIIMLLPLSYLHGKYRYDNIFKDTDFKLARIYVFTRYPLLTDKVREDGKYKTGMMVYAWFVWDKSYTGNNPTIDWIDNQEDILYKK